MYILVARELLRLATPIRHLPVDIPGAAAVRVERYPLTVRVPYRKIVIPFQGESAACARFQIEDRDIPRDAGLIH